MRLIIIAGGKGTRLGLKDIPKPMVMISGRPILYHQIELAKRYGIFDIIILSGYLSNIIEGYFGDGKMFGVKITYVKEGSPLGTAGSLKSIECLISENERFMVFYGDIVMDFNLKVFVDFDIACGSKVGTLIAHPNDHPYDSDLLDVNSDSQVISFLPKSHNKKYYRNLVNAAVYIFSKEIFKFINRGANQDLGKDIFSKVIKGGQDNLSAYITAEYIKDMGTKDRFSKTSDDFASGKVAKLNNENKRRAIFLDRDGVINSDKAPFVDMDYFEVLNSSAEAIRKINKSNYLVIVITNQPSIAKGFISDEELRGIHDKMETQLSNKSQSYIDGIYYCPHHPERGWGGEVIDLKIKCFCRKPEIGMLLEAQRDFNIDIDNSYFIGDSESDMECGKKAGCSTILIKKGDDESKTCADNKFSSLYKAVLSIPDI